MSSNRTSDEWIDQYSRSHQHPVNQFCHMIGIPVIVGALVLAAVGAWRLALVVFVVGWIFQFVGHAFEGKPPEFFSNWRFLLVGLRWWVAKIRGRSQASRLASMRPDPEAGLGGTQESVEHMTPALSPILPRTVDARLRQTGVTLADIRRAIPDEYLDPDPLRAWWTLIRVAASAAVCLFLLSRLSLSPGSPLFWQIPALLTLWIFYGWVLVGAFLIGHDCGHGSFSSSRWVNSLIGWLCLAPLANSFHSWRLTHERHHAFTQLRGHDVDWAGYLVTRDEFESPDSPPSVMTRVGYAVPCGIFLWIAWNTIRRALMMHQMFASGPLARERWPLFCSNAAMGVALAVIYGGLWSWFGVWGALKYHAVPAAVAMVTSWVIVTIQHANENSLWYEADGWTPVRGQLVSTFDVRFPRWLEYVWCYGTIHIPHHVAPAMPWYNLKKAARAIRQAYPNYYQERRFGVRYLRWLWRTPFLERIEDLNYFALAGSPSTSVGAYPHADGLRSDDSHSSNDSPVAASVGSNDYCERRNGTTRRECFGIPHPAVGEASASTAV
jgi:omega-6 fatty acid desaturase (delta-12 desaturase)